ncbi:MAG: hypothetical protein HOD99_09405 [Planctomycetaceae bacterium]|nr:hypothetical protein [Planctomycetaceae bacterium]MBT4887127.1 hypothetical protein [Planctomycetaceae bacterium]
MFEVRTASTQREFTVFKKVVQFKCRSGGLLNITLFSKNCRSI